MMMSRRRRPAAGSAGSARGRHAGVRPPQSRCARKDEAAPARSWPPRSPASSATVRCASSPTAVRLEAIEYSRGASGRNAPPAPRAPARGCSRSRSATCQSRSADRSASCRPGCQQAEQFGAAGALRVRLEKGPGQAGDLALAAEPVAERQRAAVAADGSSKRRAEQLRDLGDRGRRVLGPDAERVARLVAEPALGQRNLEVTRLAQRAGAVSGWLTSTSTSTGRSRVGADGPAAEARSGVTSASRGRPIRAAPSRAPSIEPGGSRGLEVHIGLDSRQQPPRAQARRGAHRARGRSRRSAGSSSRPGRIPRRRAARGAARACRARTRPGRARRPAARPRRGC
jgi:hypothetical protein